MFKGESKEAAYFKREVEIYLFIFNNSHDF